MRRGRSHMSGGASVRSNLGAEHDQTSIPLLGHVENLFGGVAELQLATPPPPSGDDGGQVE